MIPKSMLSHHDTALYLIQPRDYEQTRNRILHHYLAKPRHQVACISYTDSALNLKARFHPSLHIIDTLTSYLTGAPSTAAVQLAHPEHLTDTLLAISQFFTSHSYNAHLMLDGLHVLSWYVTDKALLTFCHAVAKELRAHHASATFLVKQGELAPHLLNTLAQFSDTGDNL